MKKYISFIHNPKQVITVSLIIAIIIGFVGYKIINRDPDYNFVTAEAGTLNNIWSLGDKTSTTGQNLTMSFQASGRIDGVYVKAGDTIIKGQVLASLDPENTLGTLTQAEAAYTTAVATYNKILKGATSEEIEVSETSLETAKTTLKHNKETLVQAIYNSYTTATNAVYNKTNIFFTNPESSTAKLVKEGVSFNNQLLENKINNERIAINSMLPLWKNEISNISSDSDLETLSNKAENNLKIIGTFLDDLNNLFTAYSSITSNTEIANAINLGNILSSRSLITAQMTSLTNALQIGSTAEATVKQFEASLKLKTSSARTEDLAAAEAQVKNAEGAVQIAKAAYQKRLITSPGEGTVTEVHIAVGQNATQNSPAIILSGKTYSKEVLVMIPNTAIIDQNGTKYVQLKTESGKIEKKLIIVGVSDQTNSEVISGLNVGDQIINH